MKTREESLAHLAKPRDWFMRPFQRVVKDKFEAQVVEGRGAQVFLISEFEGETTNECLAVVLKAPAQVYPSMEALLADGWALP